MRTMQLIQQQQWIIDKTVCGQPSDVHKNIQGTILF